LEDDGALEQRMSHALESELPHVEVEHTEDADAALTMLRSRSFRVLVTEAQSDAIDGLALANCVRHERPHLPLVFLVDEKSDASRARVTALNDTHVLDKPPPLERLVSLVARLLGTSRGFWGQLSFREPMELVQLVASSMPTGALHLRATEGTGTIWIEDGMIVHASSEGELGEQALQRMLGFSSGGFSTDPEAIAEQRSIFATTPQLLLECAQILDERARGLALERSGPLPILRSAAEHFERGLTAVQHKRHEEALPEWERAARLEPHNKTYQHNLRRLQQLLEVEREHKA
jgi:DNA-binding response OmpR family regulator